MAKLDQQWDNVSSVVYAESPEESDKAYSKWASTYEDDLVKLGLVLNKSLAEHSIGCIKNEPGTTMLDIGAGTGLMAEAFRDAGFKGIFDAIELNAEMLEIAKRKGIYRKTICFKISADETLPVDNGSYDIATISGALLPNHLPQGCIVPVVDTMKPGGLLIYNSRATSQNAEYQAVLVKIVERMVQAKKIELVKEELIPHYQETTRETGGPMMSMLYIYRKL